jgi:Tfp pilus assembly protein PilF
VAVSLIADALKAAQDEKRKKKLPPRPQQPRNSYFPLRGGGRREQRSSATLAAAAAVIVAAALAAVFVVRGRGTDDTFAPPISEAGAFEVVDAQVDSTAGAGVPLEAEPAGSPPTVAAVEQSETAEEPLPRRAPARAPRPAQGTVADASARPPLVLERGGRTRPASSALPAGLQITMDRSAALGSAEIFQQALAAQRQREFVAARDLYLEALHLDPRNAEAHNNLGAVYRALNDPRSAEAAYRRALELDARYAQAWSNLGALLGAQGRVREAIDALQRAAQLDPGNAGAKINLAIQYRAAGLLTEAKRLLEEVLREDPSIAQAHYALAQVLEAQGVIPGAIASYRLFLSTGAGQFPQLEEQVRRHLRGLEGSR